MECNFIFDFYIRPIKIFLDSSFWNPVCKPNLEWGFHYKHTWWKIFKTAQANHSYLMVIARNLDPHRIQHTHGRSQAYQIWSDCTPSHEKSVKIASDLHGAIWKGYSAPGNAGSLQVDLSDHQHIHVGNPNVWKPWLKKKNSSQLLIHYVMQLL